MGAADFLARLTQVLDASSVPYMLSGSMASSLHGAPRATQDLDLVVVLNPATLSSLLNALPEQSYYVSREAARHALARLGQFNIIDLETGWKADLIVRKERPFSKAEFERRQSAEVLGVSVFVASPEDVVLSKLEWARKGGGSERQLRDVGGVLDVRQAALDVPYIENWLDVLGVRQLWDEVRQAR